MAANVKCTTKFCRNRIPEARAIKHGGKCSKCQMRKWRAEHPLHAVFTQRRQKAERRGIGWEISLEQFEKFCAETGYLDSRGQFRGAVHIDREDATKPYEITNIKVLEVSENVAKGNRERRTDYYKRLNADRLGIVDVNQDLPGHPF